MDFFENVNIKLNIIEKKEEEEMSDNKFDVTLKLDEITDIDIFNEENEKIIKINKEKRRNKYMKNREEQKDSSNFRIFNGVPGFEIDDEELIRTGHYSLMMPYQRRKTLFKNISFN